MTNWSWPLRLTLTFSRLLMRDRQLVFWNFGFFLALLLVFLGLLSGGDSSVRIALTAAIVTIALMANALFSVAIGLTAARERGVFRRYRLTPLPFTSVLVASVLSRILIVALAAVVEVLAARALFGVRWSTGALSWIVLLLAGSAAFAAIGFAIAAFAPAVHVANRTVNLVFIPMLALSGASIPAAMMPEAWDGIRRMLPAAPIVDGLTGAFVRGEGLAENAARIGYLGIWTLALAVIGAYGWRRSEP